MQTSKIHAVDSSELFDYTRAGNVVCAMLSYSEKAKRWDDYHKGWGWWKLGDACKNEGIEVENAHDALSDCLMTLALCKKMADIELQEGVDCDRITGVQG